MKNKSPNTKIPKNFVQYIKSMGPGIVVALTWLGAGDLVDSAVAGANYGYSLMWAILIALFVRFIFVSTIAKYQLCNQHRESILSGFKRIHPFLPYIIIIIAIFFGHFYCSYMIKGLGKASYNLTGIFSAFMWSIIWVVFSAILIFKGKYKRIEFIFYIFLFVLTTSLIAVSIMSNPNPNKIISGIFLFDIPQKNGSFAALLVIISLIGAIGGSIANLLYPYFIQQKGWNNFKYRKVQIYELALGTVVLVIINLAIWTIGAELLYPKGLTISNLDDLANILTISIGKLGVPIFYMGVLATLFSSLVGLSIGFGYLVTDAHIVIKSKKYNKAKEINVRDSKIYHLVASWCIFSPLIWSLPGMPSFITLTIVANAAAVVFLPLLCGSLWYLTSSKKLIGNKFKNNIFENLVLLLLFSLSIWGSYQAIISIQEIV